MEYVLIGLSLLLIILLVVLYKMYARIGLLDRTLDRRDLTIQELKKDSEELGLCRKVIEELNQKLANVQKIEPKKTTADMLFEQLINKSDEDELKAMIDFRKAWNWNGKKGVSNE